MVVQFVQLERKQALVILNCQQFWNAVMQRMDSKAASYRMADVLVQEMSQKHLAQAQIS